MIEVVYQYANIAPQWPTFWFAFWGALSLGFLIVICCIFKPKNLAEVKNSVVVALIPLVIASTLIVLEYLATKELYEEHQIKLKNGHLLVAEGKLVSVELTRLSEKLLVGGTVLHSYLPTRGGADGFGCFRDYIAKYNKKIKEGDYLVIEYMMYKKIHPVELDDGRILTETPCILSVKKLNDPTK